VSLEHTGVVAGLLAGILHTLSGPDHLAAMAPLGVARPWRRWRTGLSWGWGHALGTWTVAVVALLGRELLPLEALSAFGERLVGLVLAALGVWGLHRALRHRVHTHEHRHDRHDDVLHDHCHLHQAVGPHTARAHRGHTHTSVGIGALHGVAGSGVFLAVLPAVVLSKVGAVAYVIAYGVGGMAAMAGFTWFISALGARATAAPAWVYPALLASCASFSIVMGGVWFFA